MEKKLTNEQIVEICNNVIEKAIYCKKYNFDVYLCVHTKLEIKRLFGLINIKVVVSDYIPKFTYKNAKKYANANKLKTENVWWRREDNNGKTNYDDRIKFMQWIKEQYKN